jgi:hypothetical protein
MVKHNSAAPVQEPSDTGTPAVRDADEAIAGVRARLSRDRGTSEPSQKTRQSQAVAEEWDNYLVFLAEPDAWIYRIRDSELLETVCPAPRLHREIRYRQPAGALALWKAELRQRARAFATRDALSCAACAELQGLDALRLALPSIASDWFAQARTIIWEAAAVKKLGRSRSRDNAKARRR